MARQFEKPEQAKQPGSGFLYLPPVQSDIPLTTVEKQDIARQASIARGWIVALRGR